MTYGGTSFPSGSLQPVYTTTAAAWLCKPLVASFPFQLANPTKDGTLCTSLSWKTRFPFEVPSENRHPTDYPKPTCTPYPCSPTSCLPDRVRNNFWLYLSQASQPVQTFKIKFNVQTFFFPVSSTCLVQISYGIPSFVYVVLSAILHAFIFVSAFKNILWKGEI